VAKAPNLSPSQSFLTPVFPLLTAPSTISAHYLATPLHAPLPAPPGVEYPPQPPLVRAFYGIPEDCIVFCNFNQLYKIDPMQFLVWISILKRVPNSVLWLLRFPPDGETNLRAFALLHGLAASQLLFTNVSAKAEHVRRGSLADICLDTSACNGHTTGMDILWSGTPIITMPGETFASRVAASLLSALGCPELITTSFEEYEELAVALATDLPRLRAVQAKVRRQRTVSPLFQTRLLAGNLERLYARMVRDCSAGKAPAHLLAEDEDE
jgi:protein O-GlcNAc transferase